MTLVDSFHTQKVELGLLPLVRTATALDSNGVDISSWNSVYLLFTMGDEGDVLTANLSWRFRVQHATDLVADDWAPCTQEDIVGANVVGSVGQVLEVDGSGDEGTPTNPGALGAIFKVGYIGPRRYVRCLVEANGTHTVGTNYAVSYVLGNSNRSEDNA